MNYFRRISTQATKYSLEKNALFFSVFYSALNRPRFLGNSENARVRELRRDGVSIWRKLFSSSAFIEEAKAFTEELLSREAQAWANKSFRQDEIADPATGWFFRRGMMDSMSDQMGRQRAHFFPGRTFYKPKFVEAIENCEALFETVAAYAGGEATLTRITCERLVPSKEILDWHIDSILGTFKCMIALSDVDADHAPTRFKLGSHRAHRLQLKSVYHSAFKGFTGAAYVPPALLEKISCPEYSALVQAGDCVLIDGDTVHRSTPCIKGERFMLTVYFSINSLKQRVFKKLGYECLDN